MEYLFTSNLNTVELSQSRFYYCSVFCVHIIIVIIIDEYIMPNSGFNFRIQFFLYLKFFPLFETRKNAGNSELGKKLISLNKSIFSNYFKIVLLFSGFLCAILVEKLAHV